MATEIDPYVRVLFLREVSDLGLPTGHRRVDEMIPPLESLFAEVLKKHAAADNITNIPELTAELFTELVESRSLIQEEHKFAGIYFIYSKNKYNAFRTKALESSEINKATERVGARYFRDIFDGYSLHKTPDEVESSARAQYPVPASDRVVRLGDNADKVIEQIDDLKKAVREHNDEGGKLLERRDRIEGELSAGQELLKAKSVRVRAIYAVLISTLGFIAQEFAGGVIGELAVKLLEQITTLIGL